MNVSGAQVRAARALLGWSAVKLSEKSKVSLSTIQRWEGGKGEPTEANQAAAQRALEAEGIKFIAGGVIRE
jgi:transcriptional regulator with XRE-family HTH domain